MLLGVTVENRGISDYIQSSLVLLDRGMRLDVMRKLIASMLSTVMATGAFVVAPAMAQDAQKTAMVDDGKPVDSLLLSYAFDATWVVDTQHVLMRDTYRDHYVLTLKEPCEALDMQRGFKFVPELSGQVREGRRYELRNYKGAPCDITQIEKVDNARAAVLRAATAEKG